MFNFLTLLMKKCNQKVKKKLRKNQSILLKNKKKNIIKIKANVKSAKENDHKGKRKKMKKNK